MTKDNRLYRPSWSDRGILCVHHETDEKETEATRNGNLFHKAVAHFIQHRQVPTQLAWAAANQIFPDIVKEAQLAAEAAIASFDEIKGVEYPVHIYDVNEEEITWGTVDLWGYKDVRLKLKDWKTGHDHGYSYQMAHYALGLMDQEKKDEADIEESYIATGKVKRYTLKYKEAASIVNAVYDLVLDRKNQPYTRNEFCGWCKLKGNGCPEWDKEQALATAPIDTPEILRENLQDILKDPQKLGRFIIAFRAFKSLYEKLDFEGRAKEIMNEGGMVAGLTVYDRKGRSRIDPELFLQQVVPKIGTMRASLCMTVSVDKAQEVWEKFSKEPFPVPVEPGPPITVLKENKA
jgi:hypothetical protein